MSQQLRGMLLWREMASDCLILLQKHTHIFMIIPRGSIQHTEGPTKDTGRVSTYTFQIETLKCVLVYHFFFFIHIHRELKGGAGKGS